MTPQELVDEIVKMDVSAFSQFLVDFEKKLAAHVDFDIRNVCKQKPINYRLSVRSIRVGSEIGCIKAAREELNLGLKEAKDLVEGAKSITIELSQDAANKLVKTFLAVGMVVDLEAI